MEIIHKAKRKATLDQSQVRRIHLNVQPCCYSLLLYRIMSYASSRLQVNFIQMNMSHAKMTVKQTKREKKHEFFISGFRSCLVSLYFCLIVISQFDGRSKRINWIVGHSSDVLLVSGRQPRGYRQAWLVRDWMNSLSHTNTHTHDVYSTLYRVLGISIVQVIIM